MVDRGARPERTDWAILRGGEGFLQCRQRFEKLLRDVDTRVKNSKDREDRFFERVVEAEARRERGVTTGERGDARSSWEPPSEETQEGCINLLENGITLVKCPPE